MTPYLTVITNPPRGSRLITDGTEVSEKTLHPPSESVISTAASSFASGSSDMLILTSRLLSLPS
ncbi:MAG: hypothetical protein K2G49_10525 [Muribaculum sp.]|nr:hypothetical protein [Muribaculum sp.]